MIIDDVHPAIAATKVMECKHNTAYTDIQLQSMIASSIYLLNLINKINGQKVITTNSLNKEIELIVIIKNIKFFHNELQLFCEYKVLIYLKEYLENKIKEHNLENKLKNENSFDIKIGGNGYSTALCCHYDSYYY